MLGSGSWAIEIYHRRVQKSKLFCPAPRYRTAAMRQADWRGRWLETQMRDMKNARPDGLTIFMAHNNRGSYNCN